MNIFYLEQITMKRSTMSFEPFKSIERPRNAIAGYSGYQPDLNLSQTIDYNAPASRSPTSHVPGYTGYLPSIKPENVFSKSYGRSSSISLNRNESNLGQDNVYTSQNRMTFVDQRNLQKEKNETNPFLKSRQASFDAFNVNGQSRSSNLAQGGDQLLNNFKIHLSYTDAKKKVHSNRPNSNRKVVPLKKMQQFDPKDFEILVRSREEYEIRWLVDKIFAAVDSDGNGSWNFNEVKEMFTQLAYQQNVNQGITRPSPQQIEDRAFKAFQQIDTDYDGSISKQEFLDYSLRNLQSSNQNRNVQANYGTQKMNNSLNVSDFKTLIASTNDNEIKYLVDQIFSQVDSDQNGDWSYEELHDMFIQLVSAVTNGQARPSASQLQAFSRNVFNKMDSDSDGVINKQEFLNYALKNKSKWNVADLSQKIQQFKKSTFDSEDFKQLIQTNDDSEVKWLVDKIFFAIDGDNNGNWSFDELKNMLVELLKSTSGSNQPSQVQVQAFSKQVFRQIDEDGDGKITKKEFYDYCIKNRKKWNLQTLAGRMTQNKLNVQDFKMLINTINESEIRQCVNNIFKAVDLDDNGSWSFDETKQMFTQLANVMFGQAKPTVQQIHNYAKNIFSRMDSDGDGAITKQEFLDFAIKNRKKWDLSKLSNVITKQFDLADFKLLVTSKDDRQIRTLVDKIFDQVDSDGSGSWSFDEVKDMILIFSLQQHIAIGQTRPSEELVEQNARKMFSMMDYDGDGQISKPEFLRYCQQNRGKPSFVTVQRNEGSNLKFNPADFKLLVNTSNEIEIKKIVDRIFVGIDKDGNGTWNFNEIKELFNQLALQQNMSPGQPKPNQGMIEAVAYRTFNKMDADGDGVITKKEFLTYCLQNRQKADFISLTSTPSIAAKKSIFDPNDFKALMNTTDQQQISRIVSKLFFLADLDQNGVLNFLELREMLQHFALNKLMFESDFKQTPENITDTARRVFSEMDSDGDGGIQKQEFIDYIMKMKSGKSNASKPSFNPQDFKSLTSSKNDREITWLVDKIFSSVDKDGDGTWSFYELREMLSQLSYYKSVVDGQQRGSDEQIMQYARQIFVEMDSDKDGNISKQEFLNYALKNKKNGLTDGLKSLKTSQKSNSIGQKPFDPSDFRALVMSKDQSQIRLLVDKIFRSVDTDGSGEWEFNEVKEMFRELAVQFGALTGMRQTEENLQMMARKKFQEMDADDDGRITKSEFLNHSLMKMNQNRQNQMGSPVKIGYSNLKNSQQYFNPQDFMQLFQTDNQMQIRYLVNKIFATIDKDGNGSWSYEELSEMFKQVAFFYSQTQGMLKPNKDQLEAQSRDLFMQMDLDGDGMITKNEFLQHVLKSRQNGSNSRSASTMSFHKQPVDPKDFQTLASTTDEKLISQIVDKIFRAVDTDGSGEWEYNEVKEMLKQLSFQSSVFNGIKITPIQVDSIAQQLFQQMDFDSDGKISKEEFRKYCVDSKKMPGQFQMIVKSILKTIPQTGAAGKAFNPADFKELIESKNERQIVGLVDKIFNSVDKNRDGSWSFDELREMLSQVAIQQNMASGKPRTTDEQIMLNARQVFRQMDLDSDGKITKQEFLQYALKRNKVQASTSFNPADFQALSSSDSELEIRQLVDKIFATVDTDSSNNWSFAELKQMFLQLSYYQSVQMGVARPSDQQVQKLAQNAFQEMDMDGDGQINKQEFLAYALKKKKEPEYTFANQWSQFTPQKNSQGQAFSPADFKTLMKSNDDSEVRRLADKIFTAIDTDKDGYLQFEEVLEMGTKVAAYETATDGKQKQTQTQIQNITRQLFNEMDTDRDGVITKAEFLQHLLKQKRR